MNLETRYQNLSPLVTQQAQEIHILKNRCNCLDRNDISFDCVNITNKNISSRAEEKQIGNEDDESKICERNAGEYNKCADKIASQKKNTCDR